MVKTVTACESDTDNGLLAGARFSVISSFGRSGVTLKGEHYFVSVQTLKGVKSLPVTKFVEEFQLIGEFEGLNRKNN